MVGSGVQCPGAISSRADDIAHGRSPGHAGPWPETQFYLEFQNVSKAARSPIQIYFDPGHGLKCEFRAADGTSPSQAGGGSGSGPAPTWITLPYDSVIRLRANMYGYGKKPGDGLLLCLWPPTQYWNIGAGDTNVYFLSGTLSILSPTNLPVTVSAKTDPIWSGTLHLPKMKVSGQLSLE